MAPVGKVRLGPRRPRVLLLALPFAVPCHSQPDCPVSLLQLPPTQPGAGPRSQSLAADVASGVSAASSSAKVAASLSQCPNVAAWARAAVAEQLAPWRERGFTNEAVERTIADPQCLPGKRYIIEVRGGKVVRGGHNPWAQYVDRALTNWPFDQSELRDFSVVAGIDDFPCAIKGDPHQGPDVMAPVFTNANNGKFNEVLMPVERRPQFDAGFPNKRMASLDLAANVPWKERRDIAVWRGRVGCYIGCGKRGAAFSPTVRADQCADSMWNVDPNRRGVTWGCGDDINRRGLGLKHPRMQLVNYSVTHGKECGIDAAFVRVPRYHRKFWSGWGSGNNSVFSSDWSGKGMLDAESAEHKYIITVGNNGYADRSWRMLALGSTIFLVDNGWSEWYFSMLKPFEHYVPVKEDSSDLCERLRWAREHPEKAEAIAQAGKRFIEDCLTVDLVDLYTAEMVRQLGELWRKGSEQESK